MVRSLLLGCAAGLIACSALAYAHGPPAQQPMKAKTLNAYYVPMNKDHGVAPAVTFDGGTVLGTEIIIAGAAVKKIGGAPPGSLLLGSTSFGITFGPGGGDASRNRPS